MKIDKEKLSICVPLAFTSSPFIIHIISGTNSTLIESLACMSFAVYTAGMTKTMKDKIIYKNNMEAHKIIETYEGYSELTKYYKEYLKEFSDFVKYYKIEDALFFNTLISLLIDQGYFTSSGLYMYEKELTKKNLKDFKEDTFLLGSRVFTDHGICRHTASLLNDIDNEYGFDSINLLVKTTNKNSIFLKVAEYTSMDYSDHLVVGINTKDGKFIFDPTNRSVGEFLSNRHAKRKNYVEITKNTEYAITDLLSYASLMYNDFDHNKLYDFDNSSFKKIDEVDFYNSLKEASILIEEDRQRFLEFRKKELKLIRTISDLHKKVIDSNNNYHIDNIINRDEDDAGFNDLPSVVKAMELKYPLK